MSNRGWWFGWVGLAALYLALAVWMPPADDELYYWCWSRDLQPSYYDHPPMVAYLIRFSSEVFGPSLLAARIPALVCSLIVLKIVRHLTRPQGFTAWAILTPVFTVGGVLITPDAPLLAFWALYLAWLVRVHGRLEQSHEVQPPSAGPPSYRHPFGRSWDSWLLGGVLLGCALLSKYTAALAIPTGFLSFLFAGQPGRTWLPGYILHGVLACFFLTPVLLFNIDHDFAPLRFQWEHATAHDTHGIATLGEFLGGQVLLFGLLPLGLLPWVLTNAREWMATPRLRVAACLYALPLLFFIYQGVRGPLEGNWALVSYVGFWPVAAHWNAAARLSAWCRVVTATAFAAPVLCVACAAVHLVIPLPFIAPKSDRVGRQDARNEVARAAAEIIRRHGEPIPVFAISYQWTAWLRFHGIEAGQIDGTTRRSHFTLTPRTLSDVDQAYVFAEGPLNPEHTPGFGMPEVVGTIPLVVRGTTVGEYQVMLYSRGTQPCSLTDTPHGPTIISQTRHVP